MTRHLPPAESLTVEFKSDRKKLPDTDLVETLVCLANAEGGELWLGVEDDGTATGLHADHRSLAGLAGMVAARTSPSLSVQVEPVELAGLPVAWIRVPRVQAEVATTGGVYLRLEDDALVVSNPGGLVDGVTLDNLLVTEPRPRYRTLADAMKRIGVVERSGRGVDTIYRGLLKFGRPAPERWRR